MLPDLTRHAVIEASAGTGKTYTIEQLVLRLVRDRGVPLEKILVVTYTEKATGELKDRLRAVLDAAWRKLPENDVVRTSLERFDQAPIFTIHGFCQRVLQESADALGGGHELVHDSDLFTPALREMQRRVWRRDYGPGLREVLEIAGYHRPHHESWEKTLRAFVRDFRPERGHILLPARDPQWVERLDALRDEVGREIQAVREIIGGRAMPVPDWNKPQVAALQTICDWLNEPGTRTQPLGAFCRLQGMKLKSFVSHLEPPKKPKKPPAPAWFAEAITRLERLRTGRDWSALVRQLFVHTLYELQAYIADFKSQRGQISFDDMIGLVDRRLDPERSKDADELARDLRERFEYGIIDEFQDTDPTQYRIFRRIFLEGDKQKLFVVGDPKQAIFQFRGADLPTYRTATEEMKRDFGAQEAPLDVNWRSCPALIEGLNRLFGDGGWFPNPDLSYMPISTPVEEPSRVVNDATGRPALCVVDFHERKDGGSIQWPFASFVAREIGRLLRPGAFRFARKNVERDLQAGDIAILVQRKKEAGPILRALDEAGIAYTFYKQPGLWDSAEAREIRYVLEALAKPDDRPAFLRALLTPFFRLSPEQLAQCDEVPGDHPARALFAKWHASIERREWARLFHSLLHDTGALFRDGPETERRRANLRYLANGLTREAYRQNLDIYELIETCKNWDDRGAEQDDIQPRESDRPMVQVLTIHASKGLEFPVVFLAGGLTQGRINAASQYRDANDCMTFDLRTDSDSVEAAKAFARRDRLEENRRLYYVALTRAMFKLYVPTGKPDVDDKGFFGPLFYLFAACADRSRVEELGLPIAARVAPDSASGDAGAELVVQSDDEPALRSRVAANREIDLFPPLAASFRDRRERLRSFSTMHRQAQLEGPAFGDTAPRADDEAPAVAEPHDPLRGTVFGEIVHNVLEQVDFAAVGEAGSSQELLESPAYRRLAQREIAGKIDQFTSRLSHDELTSLCQARVAELTWNALHTPLPGVGPLWRIPAADRLAELEFLVSEPESTFTTGFIDLVFRHEGQHYLLDWKTNALPDYGPESVERAMAESDYHLQYRIYQEALTRWLRRRLGASFDLSRHLGGVYYLFLRGLDGTAASPGIFRRGAR